MSIYFTTMEDLIGKLKKDRGTERKGKGRGYNKSSLVIVDEVGYTPIDRDECNLVLVYALTYRRDGESVGRWLIFFVTALMALTYRVAAGCVGGEFEIAMTHENFRKDFMVALDIWGSMDDISSDKSGVMNGAASTSEDSARRNPLDEQYSMAKLVRELRELTGLTQEKFAAKLGVTFPTINRWENDRAKPSPLALEKIESLLRSLGDKGEALHKAYFEKEA